MENLYYAPGQCSDCQLQSPQQKKCMMSDWVWTDCYNCKAAIDEGPYYRCGDDGVVRDGCMCGHPR